MALLPLDPDQLLSHHPRRAQAARLLPARARRPDPRVRGPRPCSRRRARTTRRCSSWSCGTRQARKAIGEIYRQCYGVYKGMDGIYIGSIDKGAEDANAQQQRSATSADYLGDHMGEAPVLVIPCTLGRADGAPGMMAASLARQRPAGDVELHAGGPRPRARHVLDDAAPDAGAGRRRRARHPVRPRSSRCASARSRYTMGTDFKPGGTGRTPTRSSTGTPGSRATRGCGPRRSPPRASCRPTRATRSTRPRLAAGAAVPGAPLLEVGSYCGRSTIWLGAAAREAGTVLFAVDHHRGSEENQTGWEWHDPTLVDRRPGRDGHPADLPSHRSTTPGSRTWWWPSSALAGRGRASGGRRWRCCFIDGGHGVEPARADYARLDAPRRARRPAGHPRRVPRPGRRRPPALRGRSTCPALASGRFTEVAACGSLRVLRRVP